MKLLLGDEISFANNALQAQDDFVNVADPTGPLTGLQRRLVHQFIRNEFSTHRAFGLNDGSFMQVVKVDPIQEQAALNRRLAGFKINLAKQTGQSPREWLSFYTKRS